MDDGCKLLTGGCIFDCLPICLIIHLPHLHNKDLISKQIVITSTRSRWCIKNIAYD